MSTQFARKRKSRQQATVAELVTAPSVETPGDLEEFLLKAYSFVADNGRVKGYVLWIWSDGRRVYAVTDDKYLSNALYHALRALGRSRVRRWLQGGKWIIAYS